MPLDQSPVASAVAFELPGTPLDVREEERDATFRQIGGTGHSAH